MGVVVFMFVSQENTVGEFNNQQLSTGGYGFSQVANCTPIDSIKYFVGPVIELVYLKSKRGCRDIEVGTLTTFGCDSD